VAYGPIERLRRKSKFEPRTNSIMRNPLPAAGFLLCTFITYALAAEPEIGKSLMATGLVPLADPRAKLAYIRPATDWSRYRTIEIRPLRIPDTVRDATPNGTNPSSAESYVLRDKDVAKLQEAYVAAMETQLVKAGYGLVTASRPETLIIAAQIVSIRLKAPIESTRRSFSSGGRIYSQGGGSIVMAAVFADGETGRVLAVAADRSYPSNVWGINNSVTNLAEAKRAFNKWAVAVCDRLAGLRRTAAAVSSIGPKPN